MAAKSLLRITWSSVFPFIQNRDKPNGVKDPVLTKGAVSGANTDEQLIESSNLFDAAWYAERYNRKRSADFSPIKHFARIGGRKGHAASPRFVSSAYLALNPDIARKGFNPLVHYLKRGHATGRSLVGMKDLGRLGFPEMTRREHFSVAMIAASTFFDAKYYVRTYPAVAESGLHPILHHARYGRELLLNPGPRFDATAYFEAYPEAASSDFVPLVYFMKSGRDEGHRPIQVASLEAPAEEAEVTPSEDAAAPDAPAAETTAPPTPTAVGAAADDAVEDEAEAAEPVSESEALALVSSSPLFDAGWYMMQYRDVAKQSIDPAIHYVRYGGPENRRPSVFFDPEYYTAQVPGLEESGDNPLVHYLTVGRALGKRPIALLEFTPPVRAEAAEPIVAGPRLARDTLEWTRHADLLAAGDGLVFGAAFLGPTAAEANLAPLGAYAALMGLGADAIRRRTIDGADAAVQASPNARSYRGLGPHLSTGAARICDAWFIDERTIRIRFGDEATAATGARRTVVRAFQGEGAAPSDLTLRAEALLPDGGPGFVDVPVSAPLMPVVLTASGPEGQIVEFGLLPFPSLLRGGLHYAELIGRAARANTIDDIRAYGDALVREILSGPTPAIAHVVVRRQGAIGAERIFSRPVVDWIGRVFGAAVALDDADGAEHDGATAYLAQSLVASEGATAETVGRRGAGLVLALPADAVPTIAAMAARKLPTPKSGKAVCGSYLIADSPNGRPRWSVSLPPMDDAFLTLQPVGAATPYPTLQSGGGRSGSASARAAVAPHLAIRHRAPSNPHDALMAMPLAPDASTTALRAGAPKGTEAVLALLFCSSAASARRLMTSLAAQNSASRIVARALVAPAASADLVEIGRDAERLFPGRASAVIGTDDQAEEIARAAGTAPGALMLVANDTVVAHDPRTFEALLTLAGAPRVASASCAVLREKPGKGFASLRFQSGGLFPTHVSLVSTPRLVLSAPDCLDALPNATYPVIGNQLDFAVLSCAAAKTIVEADEYAASDARADVAFSLVAAAAGMSHLCTTAVRVACVSEGAPAEILDPFAGAFFGDARWESVLSGVTILRELR